MNLTGYEEANEQAMLAAQRDDVLLDILWRMNRAGWEREACYIADALGIDYDQEIA